MCAVLSFSIDFVSVRGVLLRVQAKFPTSLTHEHVIKLVKSTPFPAVDLTCLGGGYLIFSNTNGQVMGTPISERCTVATIAHFCLCIFGN
jgi:hypothetical protein